MRRSERRLLPMRPKTSCYLILDGCSMHLIVNICCLPVCGVMGHPALGQTPSGDGFPLYQQDGACRRRTFSNRPIFCKICEVAQATVSPEITIWVTTAAWPIGVPHIPVVAEQRHRVGPQGISSIQI